MPGGLRLKAAPGADQRRLIEVAGNELKTNIGSLVCLSRPAASPSDGR